MNVSAAGDSCAQSSASNQLEERTWSTECSVPVMVRSFFSSTVTCFPTNVVKKLWNSIVGNGKCCPFYSSIPSVSHGPVSLFSAAFRELYAFLASSRNPTQSCLLFARSRSSPLRLVLLSLVVSSNPATTNALNISACIFPHLHYGFSFGRLHSIRLLGRRVSRV